MNATAGTRLERYPDYRARGGVLEFGNDRRLSAYLANALPELHPAEEDGQYVLSFRANGHHVEMMLDAKAVNALGRQCLPVLQIPEVPPASPGEDAALRDEATILTEFDDQVIRLLLRDMSSDLLLLFLWYMKDAALIRKLLGNCSERAASMLLEDLVARKEGQDPDQAHPDELEQGREATRAVLKTIHHLARKGMHHLASEAGI